MTAFFRRTRALATAMAAAMVTIGLAVGMAGPAKAAATPAQKVPLTQTNMNCDGSLIGAPQTQAFGFAVVTKTGAGGLVVAIALRNAEANTTYNIRVIQILPGNPDCASYIYGPFDGMLTTNSQGNGSTNIREPVLPGASSAFVDLNGQANPGDFFTTRVVHF